MRVIIQRLEAIFHMKELTARINGWRPGHICTIEGSSSGGPLQRICFLNMTIVSTTMPFEWLLLITRTYIAMIKEQTLCNGPKEADSTIVQI